MASATTGLLAAMALAIATTAAAQDYPSRPVRIVVPYAAGGPSDTGTRLAAEPLGRELGRPIVIENRGGGGGLNATEAYVKSEHDGYTILVGAIGPLTIIPALKPVSYDAVRDFAPLGTVGARHRRWRCARASAREGHGQFAATPANRQVTLSRCRRRHPSGDRGASAASLDLIGRSAAPANLPARRTDRRGCGGGHHRAASAIRPSLRSPWRHRRVLACRSPDHGGSRPSGRRRAGSVSWCRRRRGGVTSA